MPNLPMIELYLEISQTLASKVAFSFVYRYHDIGKLAWYSIDVELKEPALPGLPSGESKA